MKLKMVLEDLRFLIALLFGIFATILVVLGLVSPPEAPKLNLNLWAGLMMAIFSVTMSILGYRAQSVLKKEPGAIETKPAL